MSIKPLLALALALGFMGCVTEVATPPPSEDSEVVDDRVPDVDDPPGDNIPGQGDGTCGHALKDDSACTLE